MKKPADKKPLGRRLYDARASYILMLPFMLVFLVFILVPIVTSIGLSFTDYNMLQTPGFVGFNNYIRLFLEDDVFVIALKNTLLFALLTGPLGYLLSFFVAWFISGFNRALRSLITLIMYAPTMAGTVYYVWTYIFSGDAKGMVNYALISLGLIKDPIQWLTDSTFSFYVMIIVIVWLGMGTGFLAFVAGFRSLDHSLFEAAAIDGVRNRFQELWHITLPQMVPQLLFGAVMSISTSFALGHQNAAITGFPSTNYATHTLLLHMLDHGVIRYEMGYSSTIAVVMFLIMVGTWYIINKGLRKLS